MLITRVMVCISVIATAYKCKNGKLGIGYQGEVPWLVPEGVDYFNSITDGNIVIMGRKTFESIGAPLKNRLNIVLTKQKHLKAIEGVIYYNSIVKLLKDLELEKIQWTRPKAPELPNKIYVIGGSETYKQFIGITGIVNDIILTEIFSTDKITCDTYFPDILWNYSITAYGEIQKSQKSCYSYRVMHLTNKKKSQQDEDLYNCNFKQETRTFTTSENEYVNLIESVLQKGNPREDRSGVGTLSLFGATLRFDISQSIPLFTTKQVAWKTALIEILWMIKGRSDTKELEQKGIKIWKGHTSKEFLESRGLDYPEGELRYGYGHQIRNAGADTVVCTYCDSNVEVKGFDQLAYIEQELKRNPFSRRIMWNLWTANQVNKMPLPCCHVQLQFYVEKSSVNDIKYLSASVYLRSNDLALGNPFNVFAYSALVYLLAKRNNMVPKELVFNIGDAHIYNNHLNSITEQITRECKMQPVLNISDDVIGKDIEDIEITDFDVIGYYPHPKIIMDMVV